LLDPGNAETFLLQKFANFWNVISLDLDRAFAGGAAAAASLPQFSREDFDGLHRYFRGEVMNDNDGFSAAMSGFLAQDYPAFFFWNDWGTFR
jgi:hypothetical protein